MKKILASLLAITMLMTTMSACIIPASAATDVATNGFTEDFEGYGSGNWLANMATDADGKVTDLVDNAKITGMGKNTWTVYGGNSNTAYHTAAELVNQKAVVEVIAEPGNATNKVLKIDAGDLASKNWVRVRRNANEGKAVSRDNLTGKKMVIKAKFKLPDSFAGPIDTATFSYDSHDKQMSMHLNANMGANYGSTSWTILATGTQHYQSNVQAKNNAAVTTYGWFDIKYVVDLTARKTADHPADTYRGFYDGTIYTLDLPVYTEAMKETSGKTIAINSKFPQPSTTVGQKGEKVVDSFGGYTAEPTETTYTDFGNFYGTSMTVSGSGGATDYMYMDDIEVYYVDKFVQNGAATYANVDENGNWYKGEIRIPFNNNLSATIKENYGGTVNDYTVASGNYKKLFTLKDEDGNVVTDGITNAYVDGNVLVIEPAKAIERNKAYTIVADALFMDEEGQGLNQFSDPTNLVTFTAGEDPYAHIIYKEDFDGYKPNVEWLPSAAGNVAATDVEAGTWTVYFSNYYNKTGSVKVVENFAGRDNVLAIQAPSTLLKSDTDLTAAPSTSSTSAEYEGNNYFTIYRNVNGTSGWKREEMPAGKKLVYKVKVYIPTGHTNNEHIFMGIPKSYNAGGLNPTGALGRTTMASANLYAATSGGSYGFPQARNNKTPVAGKWVEYSIITDVSAPVSATRSDTQRTLINDGTKDIVPTSFFTEYAYYTNTDTRVMTEYATDEEFKADTHEDGKKVDGVTYYKWVQHPNYPAYPYTNAYKHPTPNKVIDNWGNHFTSTTGYTVMPTYYANGFAAANSVYKKDANSKYQPDSTPGETYYIDDLQAFWIDALTLTPSNNVNWEGGNVSLNFNQKIKESIYEQTNLETLLKSGTRTLSDLIVIVDETGKEIDGAIADIKLSTDEKSVLVKPDADKLELGGQYKIKIDPLLTDEYGQGLTMSGHNNPTYVDLSVSETFTPFTVTLSQNSVSGFSQGRDVKVTATFSKIVEETAIENGIVVTNTDTGATVAYDGAAWTYAYGVDKEGSTDKTKVIFDFGNLPTASYTITTNDNFVAVSGTELSSALEITITAAAQPIVLFEETFDKATDTYVADENWINAANELTDGTLYSGNPNTWEFSYYKSYTVNNNDWDIQLHWTTDAANATPSDDKLKVDDFIGVVDAPAGTTMTGKVLKVSNKRSKAYLSNYIAFRRNFDANRTAYRFDEGKYKDKILVYEADMYSPNISSDMQTMQPSIKKKGIVTYVEGIWKCTTNTNGNLSLSGGSYKNKFEDIGPAASWFRATTTNNIKNAPQKVRIVIDQSTEMDTMRMYIGNEMLTLGADQVAQLNGHAMNDPEGRYDFGPAIENTNMANAGQEWNMNEAKQSFKTTSSIGDNAGVYGVYSLVSGGGTDENTEVTVYYDNFKAYLVDSFDIESVSGNNENFNTAKGRVTYTFSKQVDTTTATANGNIVLLDASGNEIDGIESVTPDDGGYKLIVKLSEELSDGAKYTIKIKKGLKDCDGLSLRTQYSYYLYPIDEYYDPVEEGSNVYSIKNVAGAGPIECTYTPRVTDAAGNVTTPATLKFGNNEMATDMYVKDEALMKTKVDLTTSLYKTVNATATAELNETENKVVTMVTINNPEAKEMNIWAVVAVYGEYNEMLGCKIVPIDGDKVEAGYKTETPIEVTVDGIDTTKVKSVKLHVWDSYEGMVPYHKAGNLWPQQPQQ